MKVQGTEITQEQRDAATAAMEGRFRANTISTALVKAGVKDQPGQSYTAERAADRILQAERKAGRIRFDGVFGWTKR